MTPDEATDALRRAMARITAGEHREASSIRSMATKTRQAAYAKYAPLIDPEGTGELIVRRS